MIPLQLSNVLDFGDLILTVDADRQQEALDPNVIRKIVRRKNIIHRRKSQSEMKMMETQCTFMNKTATFSYRRPSAKSER